MRIGIDGTTLVGSHAGVGRFVYQICLELDKHHPNDNFFVYSHIAIQSKLPSSRWVNRVEPIGIFKLIKGIPWSLIRISSLAKKDKIDVFWASGSFVPLFFSKIKVVNTIYDLNYLLVPDTMKFFALMLYRIFFKRSLLKSSSIVCISKGTQEKLSSLLGIESHAISYPGLNPIFKKTSSLESLEVLQKYKIRSRFILAVGTLEPRKNISTLVEAYRKIVIEKQFRDVCLVLVGGMGWKNHKLITSLGDSEKEGINLLGFIDYEDLPALYSCAEVFVFPSIYEGFGMPVAEARACGSKVVATDIPELREAGDSEVIYVNPNVEGLVSGIRTALSIDEVLKRSQSKFKWSEAAKVMSDEFLKISSS